MLSKHFSESRLDGDAVQEGSPATDILETAYDD